MCSLSAPFICELQYGTTPSLEFGESPRPRSPMIVLYGTPGAIGIVFIALRKRLFGERESTLFDRRIGFSSAFSIRVMRSRNREQRLRLLGRARARAMPLARQ